MRDFVMFFLILFSCIKVVFSLSLSGIRAPSRSGARLSAPPQLGEKLSVQDIADTGTLDYRFKGCQYSYQRV